jgi:hypothetical protein
MNAKRLTELSLGGGGSSGRPLRIEKPMLMMFEHEGKIVCHIYPEGYDHTHYGLLICDLVRHLSRAFKVEEDEIWEWIERERRQPTTEITQPS